MRTLHALTASIVAVATLAAATSAEARRIAPTAAPAAVPVAATKPAAGSAADQAQRNNQLAFDLYARLRPGHDGIAFSPLSIQLAFGMLHAGARGATEREIEKVLRLPAGSAADASLGALSQAVSVDDASARMHIANSLWPASGSQLNPALSSRIAAGFSPLVTGLDYQHAAEPSRKTINAWVSEHTDNMIRDLLPPGSIREDTVMTMVSALVFVGKWSHAFDPKLTRDGAFTTLAGAKIKAPTMHQQGPARFAEVGPARVLELPYGDGRMAMDLIQPIRGPLSGLEKTWTAASVAQWLGALRSFPEVQIAIPRIKVSSHMSLVPTLKAMGLRTPFGAPDLSGLFASKTSPAVNDVIHSAVVEVDESGTRAAAATAIVMVETAARSVPAFIADRPFLFLIRDTRTGAIVFMGRIADPRK